MDTESMRTLEILSPRYVLLVCLSGLVVALLIFCVCVPIAITYWTWMASRAIAREIRNSLKHSCCGRSSLSAHPKPHYKPWESAPDWIKR